MQSKPETLNEIETRNPKSDCNQKYYVHFKPGFGLGKLSYHKGGVPGAYPLVWVKQVKVQHGRRRADWLLAYIYDQIRI